VLILMFIGVLHFICLLHAFFTEREIYGDGVSPEKYAWLLRR